MAAAAEVLQDLLGMLDTAGSGLALLELPVNTALVAPPVSGVGTFLPLSGAIYILRSDAPPRRVAAGELALVPPGARIQLAARRHTQRTVNSRDCMVQRGRWIVVPPPPDEEPVARVAAARIIGSRAAAFDDIVVADVIGCDIAGPLFRQLVAEVDRGPDGHAGFAMALMNACVVQAIRRTHAEHHPNTPMPSHVARGAIARAIMAIRASPGDNHSINSLAALVGMSRSSFLRGFGRATGTAPQRYLQQVRLEEGAALLGSTSIPVKIVAATVGFASRSHFSRAFHDVYGVDPTAYRQEKRTASVPIRAEQVPECVVHNNSDRVAEDVS